MAITSQPANLLQAAYGRELVFTVQELAAPGILANAVVTITNLDTLDVYIFRVPFVFPSTFATFDPSAIVQTYFCTTEKPDIFGDLDSEVLVQNDAAVVDFEMEIDYEYIDAGDDNKYKLTGNIDTSNIYRAFNIVREDTDPSSLDEFTVDSDRRFFTNRTLCQKICLNDNDFLQLWKQVDTNAIQITQTDGITTTTGVYDISSITDDEMLTFGSGPAQINAIAAWLSGTVTIDIDTISYTVEFGFWGGVSFVPCSELITYAMQECCPEVDCRVFWANRAGGVDAYTFNGTLEISDDPSSAQYEKPLALPRVVPDYGRGKFDSNDATIYTLESKRLNNAEAVWLRELQTSIRACKIKELDAGATLVGVVVADSRNIIKNRDEPIITRRLTLLDAFDPLIQQYG